ncbi:hypothetical protein [[Enterobacter] lignolyticus]|uniref:Pilus assembly protein n=1 Tax=[Enterobacter] lignolyticus TaxID=1334193 RepID=A0A806X529_9ENTR|nr:hypothetical protein [[Enterobacter] lignolyticus]ALR76425.1 hypothetical protein AO703_08990 [[Enterobacter] lignolyticus]
MTRGLPAALGLLAALSCASGMAAGMLKLSRTELTLAPGKPQGELRVENAGDTPLYLDVVQELVTAPGQIPERRVPVGNVASPGLLMVPDRLVLSPGQKYRMTLKVLHTPPQTQVWRVTFRPRERIRIDAQQPGNSPAPVFISVGYGVVIYQLSESQVREKQ